VSGDGKQVRSGRPGGPVLTETDYLLRSPRNARRLLAALARARTGEGRRITVEQLRVQMGIEPEE
jgi:antitoxin YefM